MSNSALQKAFALGKTPENLDGFYKGKLLLLLPQTPLEHLANVISGFFVPWKGKCFDRSQQTGNNILPLVTKLFLRLYSEKLALGKDEFSGYHAFPFKTSVTRGLGDAKKILRLNYDLPENPLRIRNIIDEVVMTENNRFLGKVYLKEKNDFRLVGFFQLQK